MALDFKQGISKQITKLNMKTSTFLEENKIKTFIGTLENDIRDLKVKAGELRYQMWRSGNFDPNQLIPLYKEISTKEAQIQEQEQQMKEIVAKNQQVLGQTSSESLSSAPGNAVICPKCGASCPANVNFCKKCGNKLH